MYGFINFDKSDEKSREMSNVTRGRTCSRRPSFQWVNLYRRYSKSLYKYSTHKAGSSEGSRPVSVKYCPPLCHTNLLFRGHCEGHQIDFFFGIATWHSCI